MTVHSALAQKVADAEKSSSSKKVTGSRYIVTKNGNRLNLLVHENVKDGKNPCTYIYTDTNGKFIPHKFEAQHSMPINQKEWAFGLSWGQEQVAMPVEYQVVIKAAIAERENFLQLSMSERLKRLSVPAEKA